MDTRLSAESDLTRDLLWSVTRDYPLVLVSHSSLFRSRVPTHCYTRERRYRSIYFRAGYRTRAPDLLQQRTFETPRADNNDDDDDGGD